MPSHERVAAAVAGRDAEIMPWTAGPEQYALARVTLERAAHHEFYTLTPVTVSHPIAVLLARALTGPELVLVSGQPAGVWRILRADPGLAQPETIVRLLGRPYDSTKYAGPGSDRPPVLADGRGWRCDLRVAIGFDGDEQRWEVTLAEDPHWHVT
jgi:hypothetical protein